MSGTSSLRCSFKVQLLGPLAVQREGVSLDTNRWPRPVQSLFKLLATGQRHQRRREDLIELLWPDSEPDAGASNLRHNLHLLRRELGEGGEPPVLSQRGWLKLNEAYDWEIDLERLKEAAQAPDAIVEVLEEAVSSFQSEPLVENRYEDWAAPIREEADRTWRELCLRLARLERDQGNQERAAHWFQRLLKHDPIDEQAMQGLLRCLIELRRRTEAVRVYQQFEHRLKEELDLEPSGETKAMLIEPNATEARPRAAQSRFSSSVETARPRALGQERQLPTGSFLGALPAGPMVARQRELERILTAVHASMAIEGRLVVLSGEPGVGKTRLAQEVTLSLRELSFVVGTGRCYEPEQSVPYYPFLDVLHALYNAAPVSVQRDVPVDSPYLAPLLSDQVYAPQTFETAGQDAQLRQFRAVTDFLELLADHAPVGVMLDDLQWADSTSLKLLLHLARHTRTSRVFLLATYRDVEVGWDHPLEQSLVTLNREGLVERIHVARLAEEGTAALIKSTMGETDVPGEFADLVHRRTEGNPFFVQQVLRALIERGDVYPEGGGWGGLEVAEIEVPESVRAAIGQRLSRLDSGTRDVLHEASVLGQEFFFEDLQGMSDRTEEQLEETLEEACRAGILAELGKDGYGFDHALTRQALYGALSSRRRRKLHSSAGASLETLPQHVQQRRAAELAWHFLQGDDAERALQYSLMAADQAQAVFADDETEHHSRTALDLAQELGDQTAESEALATLGLVLRVTSRYSEALGVQERAADIRNEAGRIEDEAGVTLQLALTYYWMGKPQSGAVRVRSVIDRLERLSGPRPSPALADLYNALAIVLYPSASYLEVREAAERAAELAARANNESNLAIAGTLRGLALCMVGYWEEAQRTLEESRPLVEAGGTWWRWLRPTPAVNIGRCYLHQGNPSEAFTHFTQGLTLAEAAHDAAEKAWALCYLGDVSLVLGEWATAREHYQRAAELARPNRYLSHALLHLAELSFLEGGSDLATELVNDAIESATQGHEVAALRKAQRLLAEKDLAEGRAEAAIERLEPIMKELLEGGEPHAFPPPVLAEAYLAVGDVTRAEELVCRRVTGFREQKHVRALAVWLRLEGMVCASRKKWQEAQEAFEEAISLAQSMPYPHPEASALYQFGVMLLEQGDSPHAAKRLQEALTIFQTLGAKPQMEQARRSLAQAHSS